MARTLLQIVQDVCSQVGQPRPSVVVSATVETPVRMLRLLNAAGRQLAADIAWNELLSVRTFTATAAQAQVEPPADYGRLAPQTALWDLATRKPCIGPLAMDKWIAQQVFPASSSDKAWTLIAGKFNIYPAPSASNQFIYAYVSKYWVSDASAVTMKDGFTADDDTPRISDELLTLELVWRWKQAIGIDYGEDMATAGRMKEVIMAANRGPAILTLSNPWTGELPDSFWPGVITA